jgi:hypothetical protein
MPDGRHGPFRITRRVLALAPRDNDVRDLMRHRRVWIALVAGLGLLLQAFASTVAASASAPVAHFDAFGNALCITSVDQSGSESDGSGKSGLPNCCTLGCGFTAQALAAPTDHFILISGLPGGGDRFVVAASPVAHVSGDYVPGNPRAPPSSALHGA